MGHSSLRWGGRWLAVLLALSACGDDDDTVVPMDGGNPLGRGDSGQAGRAGAGGAAVADAGMRPDCDCPRELYVPVCGDDGKTYDATCGRACVPVPIDCEGECPCMDCIIGGCSRELCGDAADGPPVSDCVSRPEFECYATARCKRQTDNACAFTPTPELMQCLEDKGQTSGLRWYTSCGHPVCGGEADPYDDPDIRNCTMERAGAACTEENERCDGVASCGATLICAKSDPTMGPVGCPRSRARFKQDIDYLSPEQLRGYHEQLVELPLASYRYKDAPSAGPQLGFIIEDIGPSVAVSGDHVNMYGYLSMAVAAIQVQQAQIAELQRELERVRGELAEGGAFCGP